MALRFPQSGWEGLLLLSWLHVRGHIHLPRAAEAGTRASGAGGGDVMLAEAYRSLQSSPGVWKKRTGEDV